MKPYQTFTVVPSLPQNMQCLSEIAYNLLWTWDREAIELFRRIDRDLWVLTSHNPVKMLGEISQSRLDELSKDDSFIAHMERVYKSFDDYRNATTWYEKTYGKDSGLCVAYFSAEFGITDSIPIYSGGLGILAGDYLKSSSDLGVPLVGVGLLYQKGYFNQYLNFDGWQQEEISDIDFYNIAIKQVKNDDGTPKLISVEYPTGTVVARIWHAQIGRVSLYLLDTNTPENSRDEDRSITNQLYVSDGEKRIQQEIMLGFGGVRALQSMNIHPLVYHMNEGHSAFLALERICSFVSEHKLSFSEAKEIVTATNVFTTHTPEPAGIDVFPPHLVEKYIGTQCLRFGAPIGEILALGKENPQNPNEDFSMAVLALRLAKHRNGVSELHGEVSRRMWQNLWQGVPEKEVPIGSVTNGVHIRSWISNDMEGLFVRYLGPWQTIDTTNPQIWDRIRNIPDDELWRTHERRRERLVAFARRRLKEQLERRGARQSEIMIANESLNPEALTIGFARRFATYKRALLLLSDTERLAKILCNKNRPVQIIYAGKAHPQDMEGKELIRRIVHVARQEHFRRHIVFLENYDVNIARYLVQGADLWLNTPRRLREASGTSGMKAAINGVINISTLDGWWYEAYSPSIGWSIGQEEKYDNDEYQDNVESNAIYDILEKEIIPLFYDRGNNGLPRKWVERMKNIMCVVCPEFNTDRMVIDYINNLYHSCANQYSLLTADNFAKAKELTAWKSKLRQNWSSIRIGNVEIAKKTEVKVGMQVPITAQVHLGALTPNDVCVDIYQGPVDPSQGEIDDAKTIRMNSVESHGDGNYTFKGAIQCDSSGLHGYSIRILPRHDDPSTRFEPGLILWK